jgi:hypothetical protein
MNVSEEMNIFPSKRNKYAINSNLLQEPKGCPGIGSRIL